MKMKKSINEVVPTAAVSIDPHTFNVDLMVNPKYWATLDKLQRQGLIHHETLHVAFGHLEMLGTYPDKELANIAMDLEINQYIPKAHTSDKWLFIDAGDFKDLNMAPKKGAKFYYEAIENEMKNNKDFLKKMNQLKGGGGGTNHTKWVKFEDLSKQQQKMFKNQQKHILKESYKESDVKSQGNLPGGLQRRIEKMFEKKPEVFNWKAWFRKFLGTILELNRKKTFKRESKRFAGLPGLRTKKKVSIFVSVDTSGSMGQREIADVFEQINYIYKAGAHIRVVTWDTCIHDDFIYDGKAPKHVNGGGGSDIDDVIKLYNKSRRDYTAAIHLTDGWISCTEPLLGRHLFVITANGQKFDPGSPCMMMQIPKDLPKQKDEDD